MSKAKTIFLCLGFILFPFLLTAQNDYATITVFRPAKFKMSAVKAVIKINRTNVGFIKNGGKLEYKLFTTGQIPIEVTGNNQNIVTANNEFGKRTGLNLNVQKGKNYFIKLNPKHQITTGYFEMEQTENIGNAKLKSKNFVSASELDFQENQVVYNHPKTDWTKENLIEHWKKNGTDEIEGIYEKVGNNLEYNLAVVKAENEYQIIYLSGANGTSWNEGDLKATLQKTAQFGLFKSNWFMLNKYLNKDVIVTYEKATMKTISETGNGQDLYIKIYPTYDEVENSFTTEWKSSGTGFFIDKNGYLVTNYHVIDNGKVFEIDVTKNGKTTSYEAEVISTDRQNDLAILKITSSNFKPLSKLSYNFNTNILDVGSSVFALGYPLTQIMGNEIKFTDGKISSKSGFQGDITTYQISVPIQPGNSGGPLFDEKGNLVGITSSGVNKQLADNANYAIKTSYLKLLIDSTNDRIELPNSSELESKKLTEQIKTLSEYVVIIKVK